MPTKIPFVLLSLFFLAGCVELSDAQKNLHTYPLITVRITQVIAPLLPRRHGTTFSGNWHITHDVYTATRVI
jgi:hypothetical protein